MDNKLGQKIFVQRPLRHLLMKKVQLTESEKIEILIMRDKLITYSRIADKLKKPISTVKSFAASYMKTNQISPKRGRKPLIQSSDNLKNVVTTMISEEPFMSLRTQSKLIRVSHESIRQIRKKARFGYFKVKKMPPLDLKHKTARIEYCDFILEHQKMPPIIFTDESTIQINLEKRGIWRRRGCYPTGSFIETIQHPISVMVWGGIGPDGFRTDLLRCPVRVTAESYAKMLSDNNVLNIIGNSVPNFIWQQDGAGPHRPCFQVFSEILSGRIVKWPAFSPDLSPIEQLWAIIKDRLRGRDFQSADELFQSIRTEWWNIPQEVITSLHESAYYRCIVCKKYGGECLNKHWAEVHKLHHPSNNQ